MPSQQMPVVIDVPVTVVDERRPDWQASAPPPIGWVAPPGYEGGCTVEPITRDTIFIPDGLGIREKSFQPPMNGCQQGLSELDASLRGFRAASFGNQLSRSNSVPIAVSPAAYDDQLFHAQERSRAVHSQWSSRPPVPNNDLSQAGNYGTPRVPSLMPDHMQGQTGHGYSTAQAPPPGSAPSPRPPLPYEAPAASWIGQQGAAMDNSSWNMPMENASVAHTWPSASSPRLRTSPTFSTAAANAWPPANGWSSYGGVYPNMDGGMGAGHSQYGPGLAVRPCYSNPPPWQPYGQAAINCNVGQPQLGFHAEVHDLMATARASLCPPVIPGHLASSASEPVFQKFDFSGAESVRRRLNMSETTTPPHPDLSLGTALVASAPQEPLSANFVGSPTGSQAASSPSSRRPAAEVVHQPNLPPSPSHPSKMSLSPPEKLIQKLADRPLSSTTRITYPSGVTIDLPECIASLMSVVAANARYQRTMSRTIENGELMRQAYRVYQKYDKDGNGFLTWSNGEVRDFIIAVYERFRLVAPNETQIYEIFIKFDPQRTMLVNQRECLCMVDAMLRATFIVEYLRDGSDNGQLSLSLEGDSVVDDMSSERDRWEIPSETPSLSVGSTCTPRVQHSADEVSLVAHPTHGKHQMQSHRHRGSQAQGSKATRGRRQSKGQELAIIPSHRSVDIETQTPSPPKDNGLAAAAVAAAAAAAAAVAAATAGADTDLAHAIGESKSHDALSEAKAETQRLRQELQYLRELEAAHVAGASVPQATMSPASRQTHIALPVATIATSLPHETLYPAGHNNNAHAPPHTTAVLPAPQLHHTPVQSDSHADTFSSPEAQQPPVQRTCFSPLAGPPDESLLWTARAHAENCRLERELATLKEVAMRQRGEVQRLNGVKARAQADSADEMRRQNADSADDVQRHEKVSRVACTSDEEETPERGHGEELRQRMKHVQQREREAALERDSIIERERALRDQELNLALERERQMVRNLVKERMLEQREQHLEREMHSLEQKKEVKESKSQATPVVRPLTGAGSLPPLESPVVPHKVATGQREACYAHVRERELENKGSQFPETLVLGSGDAQATRDCWGASAADTEPEAEAEADVGNSGLTSVAAAAAENLRLRQELLNLRQLAQWQKGEVDAALACSGATERIGAADLEPVADKRSGADRDEDFFSTVAEAISGLGIAAPIQRFPSVSDSEFSATPQLDGPSSNSVDAPAGIASNVPPRQQVQQRHGGCIPTEPSPGPSPVRIGARQSQIRAGINEYDRSIRTLMSRVSDRHGGLAAVATAASSTEEELLPAVGAAAKMMHRGDRHNSVHQPLASRPPAAPAASAVQVQGGARQH